MSIDSKEKERKKKLIASARKLSDASAGKASKAFKVPSVVNLWTPEAGEYVIDVIGYIAKEGNPACEAGFLIPARLYHTHRGIGPNKDTYTCPGGTFGKPCPICRYRDKVVSEEGWQSDLAKQLRPSDRHLWNIFDPKQPEKGIQIWDISDWCFGKAVTAALDRKREFEEERAYHDPDNGVSLEITLEKRKLGQNEFIECTHVKFVKREHKLPDGLVPICCDDLIVETDFQHLKAAFEAGSTGEEEEKMPVKEAPKKAENPKEESKKNVSSKVKDDDDDFDDEEDEEDDDFDDDEWEDDEEDEE